MLGLGGVPRWEEGKRPVQIAAGGAHSVAVLEDGGVVTWGCDNFGQVFFLGKVPFTVTLSCKYTWALTGGGGTWGCNNFGQLGSGKPLAATAGLRLVPGQVFLCVEKSHF